MDPQQQQLSNNDDIFNYCYNQGLNEGENKSPSARFVNIMPCLLMHETFNLFKLGMIHKWMNCISHKEKPNNKK